jgi:hypothetical protein
MHIILATWEAGVGRIMVRSQPSSQAVKKKQDLISTNKKVRYGGAPLSAQIEGWWSRLAWAKKVRSYLQINQRKGS